MQAIIMAGGKGTRLKSITGELPKPLVHLHNKSLLDHIIDHVRRNGFDNIIICGGYLGNVLEEHVINKYGNSVKVSIEDKPLGTAGALHLIKDLLEDEFFILFGDIYTTINLKNMLKFHKQQKADVTIALHTSDHPQDSTVVEVNKKNKIVHFVEKPGDDWVRHGNLTATSLYILKKNVIDYIAKETQIDFAKNVFPAMLTDKKKLFGYKTEEYAKDIGTPERYNNVLQLLKK